MAKRRAPGEVRDAIVQYLEAQPGDAGIAAIHRAVDERLGGVPASSVRSYLRLNTPAVFRRTGRGSYRIVNKG